jgi:hypothetical protein
VSEVRSLIDEIVEAVEGRRPQVVLDYLAFDFRSNDGLTYPDVQSILLEYLIPERTIGARLESLDLTPGAGSEEIRARAAIRFARGTRLSDRALPPPPGSVLYDFDILFRRLAGEWRAVRGGYERRSAGNR